MNDGGFVLERTATGLAPRARCEMCGVMITDIKRAGVAFPPDRGKRGSVRRGIVLCKVNHCLSRDPYRAWGWEELEDYLLWLVFNSGIKTEKALLQAWRDSDKAWSLG